jgi:hypothetical protein
MNEFRTMEIMKACDCFDAFTPRGREEIKEAIKKLDDRSRNHLHRTRTKGNDGRSEIRNPKIRALA